MVLESKSEKIQSNSSEKFIQLLGDANERCALRQLLEFARANVGTGQAYAAKYGMQGFFDEAAIVEQNSLSFGGAIVCNATGVFV